MIDKSGLNRNSSQDRDFIQKPHRAQRQDSQRPVTRQWSLHTSIRPPSPIHCREDWSLCTKIWLTEIIWGQTSKELHNIWIRKLCDCLTTTTPLRTQCSHLPVWKNTKVWFCHFKENAYVVWLKTGKCSGSGCVLPDIVVGAVWTKLTRIAPAVAKANYISATMWSILNNCSQEETKAASSALRAVGHVGVAYVCAW